MISVDIICVSLFIRSDGKDHRNEVIVQKFPENVRIHPGDFADKTDVLSVRHHFPDLQQISVHAADAHGVNAQLLNQRNQVGIYFSQHHLRHFQCLPVCDAEAVVKFRNDTGFFHPAADLFSAAVHDDRPHAHQLQKGHILDHMHFQIFILHCAAAVLHDHRVSVEALNIRERLDQDLCFFLIFLSVCHLVCSSL